MANLSERYVIGSWEDRQPFTDEDAKFLGGKALGLLRIPSHWAPPFVVLTKRFREAWNGSQHAADAIDAIPVTDREVLQHFFDIAAKAQSRILVRSNSPKETGSSGRGVFRSVPASGVVGDVCRATDDVLLQDPSLYATLQLAVEPGLPGHMSNERRVSPRRSLWLIEDMDGRFEQERIEAARSEQPVSSLAATSEEELLQVLRRIAGFLQTDGNGYFHCEWVWDRERVWLVQADAIELPSSDNAANLYLRGADLWPFTFTPRWSKLKHFSTVDAAQWRKLRRPKIFTKWL